MIKLPESVEFIIEKMNKAGERADIVGGCVRDYLLGKEPSDYDLTTSAKPERTKEIFADFRTIDTGIKHGTVTLMLEGEPYEITTYRIDGEYKDNRHPECVTFSKNIEDDLSRRDFTMNAIAYNPTDGLTDPFGGREDIKSSLIRAVGDAKVRFTEDALRILRGVRFSSTLGFAIEKDTASAMKECRELLKNVSAERIFVEWKKLLGGKDAVRVIVEYLPVFTVFLPELSALDSAKIAGFDNLSLQERNVLLFYLTKTTPDGFDAAMHRLKTDNDFRLYGKRTLECIFGIDDGSDVISLELIHGVDINLMMLAHIYGAEASISALKILAAIGKVDPDYPERLKSYIERGCPYRLSDLAVNGSDLAPLGISGKEVGKTLESLILAVIAAKIENKKSSLLAYAKAMSNR